MNENGPLTRRKLKNEERRKVWELAIAIWRVMEGDLVSYGQSRIRIDTSKKRTPMRTFYVKPMRRKMSPAEHMRELKRFRRFYNKNPR